MKELTGKDWREVIGQSLLFMWAKAIDLIMHGEKSKWFDQGGSEAFFKWEIVNYISYGDNGKKYMSLINVREFLPKYLTESYEQPDVINTESQQVFYMVKQITKCR